MYICLKSSRELKNTVIKDEEKLVEEFIKWDTRRNDDFVQLILDDPDNKSDEILTKLNLINAAVDREEREPGSKGEGSGRKGVGNRDVMKR